MPDPATSLLWAHAFAATSVHTVGSADPVQNGTAPPPDGCRLLAPRKLEPQTEYIACLVPVLKATALAGLGKPDAEIQAALAAPQPNYAWSTTDESVDLPVYLYWKFSCGQTGDFESLARALKEVPVGPGFGTRPLDLGLAGGGMPVTTTTATVFRGALSAPGVPAAAAWPDPADSNQVSVDISLGAEIGDAAKLTAAAASAAPGGRPAIGPLLYARAAAGRGDVTSATPATDWFDQLNRDPRMRATAGLGTRVLRRNVEDVMARAWDQVGDVEHANSVLRRLQAVACGDREPVRAPPVGAVTGAADVGGPACTQAASRCRRPSPAGPPPLTRSPPSPRARCPLGRPGAASARRYGRALDSARSRLAVPRAAWPMRPGGC